MEQGNLFTHRRENGFFVERSWRVDSPGSSTAGTFPGAPVAAARRRKT